MRYDDYRDIVRLRRPLGHHVHMDIPHRAKQFAPFAALKGFEDCVYEKEILYVERADLSEDRKAELNFRLRMLQYGMEITAAYFIKDKEDGTGHYTFLTGKVTGIEPERFLKIGDVMIRLENLYDIAGDGL